MGSSVSMKFIALIWKPSCNSGVIGWMWGVSATSSLMRSTCQRTTSSVKAWYVSHRLNDNTMFPAMSRRTQCSAFPCAKAISNERAEKYIAAFRVVRNECNIMETNLRYDAWDFDRFRWFTSAPPMQRHANLHTSLPMNLYCILKAEQSQYLFRSWAVSSSTNIIYSRRSLSWRHNDNKHVRNFWILCITLVKWSMYLCLLFGISQQLVAIYLDMLELLILFANILDLVYTLYSQCVLARLFQNAIQSLILDSRLNHFLAETFSNSIVFIILFMRRASYTPALSPIKS